jgi:hypothetical protein
VESVTPLRLWTGRALSGLAALFLAFDVSGKLLRVAPVVQGTVELGYPESSVVPIGLLAGLVLYGATQARPR